eukprot:395899_1
MPKRARGSFVLFTKDERPKIQQENPTIKFTDLGAVMGKRWRNLPAEERRKYDNLAEQDKTRFAQEMELYKQQVTESEQYRLQQERHSIQDPYYTHDAAQGLPKHEYKPAQQHEIYQQEDHHQQHYYVQDQTHVYHQSAPSVQQDQHQIFHQGTAFKTEEGHEQLQDPNVYDQPQAQLYHEESDLYKTEHDVHHAAFY